MGNACPSCLSYIHSPAMELLYVCIIAVSLYIVIMSLFYSESDEILSRLEMRQYHNV